MNLNFLSPTYLWGILGIAAPLLVHLLTRRRQTRLKFSALYLLQEARKRSLKRSAPNRLLLLLIRCLALVFFSLALANPIFSFGSTQSFMFSTPSAAVFILDNSYSMGRRTEKATLYDDAENTVSALIRKMPAHSEFSLITAAPPVKTLQDWTSDPETIPSLLKASQASFGTTDIGKAVTRATEMLDATSQKVKIIYLLTDRTMNGWNKDSFPTKTKENYPIKVIDFSSLQKGENRAAITNIEVSREFMANSRSLRVKASVVNLLENKKIDRLPISIWANGKKQSEGIVELPPKGTAMKEFLLPYAGEELFNGYVEIEDDALATDNRRYFNFQHDQTINVLVVDGDPRAVANQSESFYLERALNPFSSNISDINPTVSTLNELPQNNLLHFPAVILCNVRNLPINYAIELENYVLGGGALFVTLGDQIDIKYYNEKLGNLLPVRIETVLEEGPDGKSFHLQPQSGDHPTFKIFSAKNLKEMGNVRFKALYKVEPREDKKFSVPMSFEKNLPAIIETTVGKGKVILYTTSIDRDWNEFPIQPTFLPWIQRWVKYASRGIDTVSEKNLLIGETLVREATGETELVQTPTGKIIPLTKNNDGGEARFEDSSRPGTYAIYRSQSANRAEISGSGIVSLPSDAERIGAFTVNIDTRESDPETITDKEIKEHLTGMQVEFANHEITEETTPTGNSMQLTTPLLLLMAFMFLCEGWLVRKD
jgi:hypothetical protein